MEYRLLGLSGCAVSALALGTLTFGNETSETDSFAQLDRSARTRTDCLRRPATPVPLTTPTASAASPSATAASQAAASRRN